MSLRLGMIALCLVLFASLQPVYAQPNNREHTAEVSIVSEDPIVRAYALVIRESAGTDIQERSADQPVIDPQKPATVVREAKVSKADGDTWRLTVDLEDGDLLPKTRVTFVATTQSGEIIPGPLTWITEPEKSVAPAQTLCQSRPDSEQISKLFALEEKALRTLLEVRTTRAQVLEKRLRQQLTPETIAQLERMEGEFGLSRTPRLTMDLELPELTRRIGLIESILKNQ